MNPVTIGEEWTKGVLEEDFLQLLGSKLNLRNLSARETDGGWGMGSW